MFTNGMASNAPSGWHLVWLATFGALMACGSGGGDTPDLDATSGGPNDGGATSDAGDGPTVDPNLCTPGQTVACVCEEGGIGERDCVDGMFTGPCTSCEQLATATGTKCEAGRFVGTITADRFYPAAAGLCGIVTLFGTDGDGTDPNAAPNDMAFEIESTDSGEFFIVSGVGNCLELAPSAVDRTLDGGAGDAGAGDAGATPSVAVGLGLEGDIDCATGEFTGELRGVYKTISVCDSENANYFSIKGTIRATYDPDGKRFENGTWELHEPPQLLDPLCVPLGLCQPPGGEGAWEARLDPGASGPASDEACYEEDEYVDFELPQM